MTSLPDFNKVLADFQNAFPVDQKAFEEGLNSIAKFNERFSAVALEAASKSNEIASRSVNETLANLRDLSVARKKPADYGVAFADFVQGQFDLAVRSGQDFSAAAQVAGTQTVDLASEAGVLVKDKVSANFNAALKTAKQSPSKAA